MMEQQQIVAFCFDLRGYKQLLKANPGQLAAILQHFVAFLSVRCEQLPQLRQLSLQGDALIGVCAVETPSECTRIVEQLANIVAQTPILITQLDKAGLPRVQFGLGIDTGQVLVVPTAIPSPHGDLFVGKVVSTAIKLSDLAMRPPFYAGYVVSEAIRTHWHRVPRMSVYGEQTYHYYFKNE